MVRGAPGLHGGGRLRVSLDTSHHRDYRFSLSLMRILFATVGELLPEAFAEAGNTARFGARTLVLGES